MAHFLEISVLCEFVAMTSLIIFWTTVGASSMAPMDTMVLDNSFPAKSILESGWGQGAFAQEGFQLATRDVIGSEDF